ncbi:MAG: hypothetical protein LBH44_01810 [Treponema sp.]|jgi:hypothetical protein|nr:hypothetical protein [Treponema sp.]
MTVQEKQLYSLIPLSDFKSLLGIDDREDKQARFCLVTSTFTIEQYCKRRLLRKKFFEVIEFNDNLLLPLREFPVAKILAVYVITNEKRKMRNEEYEREKSYGEMLEPEFYRALPDCGTDIDIPFHLSLSPALLRYRGLNAIKVVYWAGYKKRKEEREERNGERAKGEVPADLASACLELAAWNFSRYKGRRVGMTGNIRGSGKEGEHFEMSMPSNVCNLLEPYKRKVI